MIPAIRPRAATVQGLDGVQAGRLRAALAWAHQCASRTGTFPATLLADRLQVPVDEAATLLNNLTLLGVAERYRAPSDAWVYACGPLLAAAPAADPAARPQEEILPRELWAAIIIAQAETGLASGEAIAELLDTSRRVDRVDVTLRLAVLAVRGLLLLGPDRGAAHRQWQATARGTYRSRDLLARALTDHEVWTVLGADPLDVDVDLLTAARRLGVAGERLEGWVDRRTRAGHFTRVGPGLRLTDVGREAINAVREGPGQ
ncbi:MULTISPECIES: hypothetical protein [Frankia]|uniref:Uncharacterized protein n=1 Tax=Frankia alni (strain DSM 45986 / CECT 9034 / ACN14a) TaxID=326424 RepID=Q0RM80_FRAAA|nr:MULTISPECIES: hypothetical protein [Frankia]CAJ61372.1 hypothetical protein FRAAL2726 [Frankia alni ACN14a]